MDSALGFGQEIVSTLLTPHPIQVGSSFRGSSLSSPTIKAQKAYVGQEPDCLAAPHSHYVPPSGDIAYVPEKRGTSASPTASLVC